MLKKYIKILMLLVLITLVMASIVNSVVYANNTGGSYSSTMEGLITDLDAANASDGGTAVTSVNSVVAIVITIARIIGVTVAIVMLLVIAMKYMTAAPGEKADIKKSAIVYVVGAIVIFAVTGILGIINNFSSNIKK